ncbi:ornithine cyclodeaminase family protein [Pseudophaeobacter sp. EL27]|uniref:ornithine cyclodeaminase family protein n=1 Tax=Pseudophaeobacter sp. EL27 TaxID=2107580 RepID=UPI000EFC8503|nr:ornithine cyclodeaminase family protein [Pseudophaeobacter sp. EL27]
MIELDRPGIQKLVDNNAGSEAVRHAYIAQAEGRVQSPPVAWLDFKAANGECHVKTGYITGSEGFAIKIATGFYDNPERGLATSNGMLLVFSAQTGEPLAVLKDDGWLTDLRTGYSGALATHALARKGYRDVLIVGAGIQCLHQAQSLQRLAGEIPLTFKIWARHSDRAKAAADRLSAAGLEARPVTDLQSAAGAVDAIITITPSKTPLIFRDWVRAGTHITAVGADCPGKQELDVDLVARADLLICDLAEQALHEGEFQSAFAAGRVAEKDLVALGHVLSGAHPGRLDDRAITIADLSGLAALDAATALTIVQAFRQQTTQKVKS